VALRGVTAHGDVGAERVGVERDKVEFGNCVLTEGYVTAERTRGKAQERSRGARLDDPFRGPTREHLVGRGPAVGAHRYQGVAVLDGSNPQGTLKQVVFARVGRELHGRRVTIGTGISQGAGLTTKEAVVGYTEGQVTDVVNLGLREGHLYGATDLVAFEVALLGFRCHTAPCQRC